MDQAWTKSSFSDDGGCVQWCLSGHEILVRDSKDPAGPVLRFTSKEWSAFLDAVRAGEVDLT